MRDDHWLDAEDTGAVRRRIRGWVTLRPVALASSRLLPRTDRIVLAATGGRTTAAALLTGLPIVTLTTTGARTGLPRAATVMAVPRADGTLLVLGANFGSTRDPAWVHNLRASRRATVTRRGRSTVCDAVELHGAEHDEAFEVALRWNPGWTRFRDAAGARTIPVLALIPTSETARVPEEP